MIFRPLAPDAAWVMSSEPRRLTTSVCDLRVEHPVEDVLRNPLYARVVAAEVLARWALKSWRRR
jgi:hypothetical protein